MLLATDLHIHSALSPCAEDEMTPENIVNMAFLKGLDIIAVTDHNAALNLPAVVRCAAERGIVVVAGMEVETSEEVHVICLFPTLHSVMAMHDVVFQALPDRRNREDVFGNQWVMDENGKVTGKVDKLLMTATNLQIGEVAAITRSFGGVAIPAHVNRESFSILSNLGSIPENLDFTYLELSRHCDSDTFLISNPDLVRYEFIRSSDAHRLGDIFERENFLNLREKSAECLIRRLRAMDPMM